MHDRRSELTETLNGSTRGTNYGQERMLRGQGEVKDSWCGFSYLNVEEKLLVM